MIGSYLAVFAMWRAGVPAASVMMKYFTSRPTGNPLISNLLSCFSHYSFLHLFCNGYVFLSFAPPVIDTLGLEQSAALYISGGVIASFAGIIPKLIRGIQVSSLGASGAIMCYLGYVCTTMPDSRLSIAFISEIFPHSFSAQQGLIGLMAMDTLGLILGWKLFDHAAHLGGVIFGIWYAKYGRDWVWSKRHQVQKLWRQIKSDSN
ncbi:hypothetical protein FSP39_022453 [Pinctada imbricata]|uniref:rhomboid protease n=1 Tax=Pinctada imbricata TaxID=66713 RepID=A0AA89BU61_PINIB|nr:hypothetical protein FSP39_022453 [Pinctada imbricata]